MQAWLERMRALWRRIFFWQGPTSPSAEFKPSHTEAHALVLAVAKPSKVPRWKQLRFVGRVLNENERRIFWIALIVCLVGISVGSGDLVRTRLVEAPAEGGSVTEALVGAPKYINPLYASVTDNDVDRDLATLLFAGLFRISDSFEAVPDLVERYRWTDDGLTLEVVLREGLRFHDGEPLTANDVVFTYQSLKDPAWRSPLQRFFVGLKQTILVDELTVQFQLDAPDPSFLLSLNVGILPAHIWTDIPAANAQLADANIRPIGSGPYRVASFTRDGKGTFIGYSLTRFDGYHGLKPYVRDWRIKFYPDRTSAAAAFSSNQVDVLGFVPWGEAEAILGDQHQTISVELPQKTIAYFNVKDALLKDEGMRRALTLAVDPSELPELLGNHATLATSPFPFLSTSTGTQPDLEGSRALLEKLGWKLAEGASVRTRASTTSTTSTIPLVLRIDVPNQPDLVAVAEFLRRRWSLVGVQVDLQSHDAGTFAREALPKRAYQILVWNVLFPPSQDLSPLWASAQTGEHGKNFSVISDRQIDQALENVLAATSTEALARTRDRLTDAIVARHPALFLVQPSYAFLVSKQIQGVEPMRIALPAERYQAMMKWYVETRYVWQ